MSQSDLFACLFEMWKQGFSSTSFDDSTLETMWNSGKNVLLLQALIQFLFSYRLPVLPSRTKRSFVVL